MTDLYDMILQCIKLQNENIALTAGEEDMCLVPRRDELLPQNTSSTIPVSDHGIDGYVPLTEDTPQGNFPIYGQGCGP
jgi:hypothetical protein